MDKPPPSGNDIADTVREAAAEGINRTADDLKGQAVLEAPIEEGTLRASARSPMDDETHRATPEDLEAFVSFNTIYAAAQHEGEMEYMRNGKLIVWKVKHHPMGGKSHYLGDPLKAMIPDYEEYIGLKVRAAIERKYGAST